MLVFLTVTSYPELTKEIKFRGLHVCILLVTIKCNLSRKPKGRFTRAIFLSNYFFVIVSAHRNLDSHH